MACGSDDDSGSSPGTGGSGGSSGASGGSSGAGNAAGSAGTGGSSGAGASGGSAGSAGTPGARPLEGFGASTKGGSGQPGCDVSSLGDSGPGTLRDCVSQSKRNVTFSVGGKIELASPIKIDGLDHITIDGSTAPAPGITVTAGSSGVANALFIITGMSHDIIVRHMRFSDATDTNTGDTFRLYGGSYNIVVDHCSFRRGADGAFDITSDVHDVTAQWCIIAETVKNQLISYTVNNISLHHNLYVHGAERNPQLDSATNVDMVNNVIFDWGKNYGTRIRNNSSVNLVKNYYLAGTGSDVADAVVIDSASGADVYSEGNVIPSASDDKGTRSTRIPAPPVTEMSAEAAFDAVLAEAGAFPRDADDLGYVADVKAAK